LNKSLTGFFGMRRIKGQLKLSWLRIPCAFRREKGVLGLKKIEEWNHASIMRHIWNIFTKAGSIWVAWIKEYILRGKNFWKIGIPPK
jgi:hypothetical protein